MSRLERFRPTEPTEPDLWREEESQGSYRYPLPTDRSFVEAGKKIAEQDSPVEDAHQLAQYIVGHSPESHKEAFNQAIDFIVPDGTPVIAAASGKVVKMEISNTEWGADPSFSAKVNYIAMRHPNDEYTEYHHLALNSIPDDIFQRITEAETISAGTVIAKTGKTGWTDRDHLHFMVYRREIGQTIGGKTVKNPYGFKSLKPRFEE